MQPAFEDIRIVDLDTRRTTGSRVHESMRVVYLRLDRAPPDREWIRLFHEERESRINPLRCGLWIEDDSISFDCLLRDVESGHLPDIQRSIDHANRRYREVLAQRRDERLASADGSSDESAALAALRERVRAAAAATPATPVTPVAPVAPPAPPAPPAPAADAADVEAELQRRRLSLRERYRAALAQQRKESSRGDS